MNEIKPDLIDTYDALWGIQKRIPLIYSSIFFLPYAVDMLMKCRFRLSYFHLQKGIFDFLTIKNANGFIVEHSKNRDFLIKFHGIKPSAISVIPYGYDKVIFDSIEQSQLNVSNREIIFAGRLLREKGIFNLLIAFGRIANEYPEWKLTYIGDGLHRDRLIEMIRKLDLVDRVALLGFQTQEDTFRRIAESSIFVLPSMFEGLPSSIIQAMILGKTVIASDTGGIGSDLIIEGENGILIERSSLIGLERALRLAISNSTLRARYGIRSKETAKELTVSDMINKTIATYDKMIKNAI